MPICAYCKEDKKLLKSHAIPDAIIKPVFKHGGGQAIFIPDGDREVYKGQDSGKAELLCTECEDEFNRRFDDKIVKMLRTWSKKSIDGESAYRCVYSKNQLAQSLASIIWRACVSKSEYYKLKVSSQLENQVLSIVKGETADSLNKCSVRVARMYDRNYDGNNGHSPEYISLLGCFVSIYEKNKKKTLPYTFMVSMSGFLFGFVLEKKDLNQDPFLIDIRLMHYRDFPPIAKMLDIGNKKILDGNTTLKNYDPSITSL